jgi:MFS transporter, AAHS family, 3-hydroxyphenylpropionic acid transporter
MSAVPSAPARTAYVAVGLCFLAALCEGVDIQAAGVTAAGIRLAFMPSNAQLGNFFAASTLGLFGGALIGGRLSDRLGRRLTLIISVGLFGIFSLLTPLAWNMPSLTLSRLITGLGLGGAFPNIIALVAESSDSRRRSANVTIAFSAMPLGGALASLFTLGASVAHWRWIYVLGGVLPVVIVPMMVVWLKESAVFRHARGQTAVVSAAVGSLRQMSSVFSEGRAIRTLLLWASFYCGLLVLYLLLNWLPTLLADNGLNHIQTSGAQVAFNLGGAASSLVIGRLLESRLRKISVAIAFLALPVLLMLLSGVTGPFAYLLFIVLFIGAAILAAQAYLYATAPACYPTLIRGFGVGLAVAIGRLGSISGPALGGILKASGEGTSHLLLDLVPVTGVAALCAIGLVLMSEPQS